MNPNSPMESSRRSRRVSIFIAAIAIIAGLMLAAAGEAYAGGRSSFSIGFSIGSGGHYSHRGSRYYGGFNSYHGYRSPFYRSYGPTVYYRSHYPRVYYPYSSGVSLNYNTYSYDNNTAQLIYPPQSRVYTTTAPVVTTTTYTAPSAVVTTPPHYEYSYQTDGWALWRNNRARDAVDAFAKLAEQSPNDGLPKIGYAVSQASIGNSDKASWAMRKAILYDAASLDRVPQDPASQQAIDQLLDQYRKRADGFARVDDPFMIAALQYITRDYDNAKVVADAIVAEHPDDSAARTLSSMIDHQLQKSAASMAPPIPADEAPNSNSAQYTYPYQQR